MPYKTSKRASTQLLCFDQVVPTVERLCSKLCAQASPVDAPPMATEFRWMAIPLGILISTGTFSRRRSLMNRIVNHDLGLGKRMEADARDGGIPGGHTLSHMDEKWVAQVLLPALDHVGWHR